MCGVKTGRDPAVGMIESYRLRWQRKRLLARAWWHRRDLTAVNDRTAAIKRNAILP